ncbi:YgcG family protein [Mesorhizobium sp. J428]|uniref:TPM domain-containing protein n=1 Tax=Mesorhizobium sp. J428 TaxID=2898440 RepID=UPI0021511FF5|nr:YgcG family protein [Mesorhizobium sp. J428]MCR5856791.1 YgcG family protein [Mesorhizobium sp. J428]
MQCALREGMSVGARLLAAVVLLALSLLPAFTAELLPLTGRVVDQAGMIDAATEAELTAKLAAFEQKSSDQIVVATMDSLDGESIEDFANRQFRAWGLGQAGENNGILLLVAKDDRKMRIEVGYGLEGTLTDLHSKLIIENTMVPAFRAGDFSGGISRAVDDIIMVLEGNAAELEARAERNQDAPADIDWFVVLFVTLWVTLFVGGFLISFLAPIYGKKLGPNRYRWLGMDITIGGGSSSGGSYSGGSSGWSSGSSGGGFSGGGGSSGGGGASGGW